MKKLEKNIFIFSVLMIVNFVIFRSLSLIDELYNYNFARNIINGNILYVDFNAVIFPFYPMIIAFFLRIFGEELIVYRILQVVIYVVLLYFSFKLLKKLKIDNKIKNYIIVAGYVILMSFVSIAEYNLFTVMLALIILNLENFKKEDSIKNNVLIGILVGLSIGTKQSIGILLSIVSVFSVLLKENTVKEKIKYICMRIIRTSNYFRTNDYIYIMYE